MEVGGRFRLGALIGRGASGSVYEGLDLSTGGRVAVKAVDCRRFKSIADLEAVQEEAALLSTLRHRHIVRLQAVPQIRPSHMFIVMEHAGGGTLHDLLRRKVGRFGGALHSGVLACRCSPCFEALACRCWLCFEGACQRIAATARP